MSRRYQAAQMAAAVSKDKAIRSIPRNKMPAGRVLDVTATAQGAREPSLGDSQTRVDSAIGQNGLSCDIGSSF